MLLNNQKHMDQDSRSVSANASFVGGNGVWGARGGRDGIRQGWEEG